MSNRLEAAVREKCDILVHEIRGEFRRVAWIDQAVDGSNLLSTVLLRKQRALVVHKHSDPTPVSLDMYARAREETATMPGEMPRNSLLISALQKLDHMQEEAEKLMHQAALPFGPLESTRQPEPMLSA